DDEGIEPTDSTMVGRLRDMDMDHNVLFGALALQNGLIDSQQFTDSCEQLGKRPETSLEEVLVSRGFIDVADKPHVEYLVERALDKHHGDARATLSALPSFMRR